MMQLWSEYQLSADVRQQTQNRQRHYHMADKILGFIGLGVMGEPMCGNLIDKSPAGTSVVAHDLNPAPLQRLQKRGLNTANTTASVANSADIIFLSLPGGAEVASVLRGADGVFANARPGTIIVDLSTSEVSLTRELASEAAGHNLQYADAPVARTRQAAKAGTLAIMVGASKSVYESIKPCLDSMASDVLHCGDIGAGQMVKILNNMVLFQTVVGLAEALTMARRAGLDGEVLFDALTQGSANSFALQNHGRKALLTGEFPEQAFSTSYARKDLLYALQLAEDTGTETPAATTVLDIFDRTIAAGKGDNYWPALLNVIDKDHQ
jgi:3-hydroxyisobutyrate dehydrogenase-like beta-hydroxyacid dehydrogenase